MKTRLCKDCKNNFLVKRNRYYKDKEKVWRDRKYVNDFRVDNPDEVNLKELIKTEEFCVYTHEYMRANECSFYNRKSEFVELERKMPEINSGYDGDRFQDINTTGESQLSNREYNRDGGNGSSNPHWGTGEKGDSNPDTQKEETKIQKEERERK